MKYLTLFLIVLLSANTARSQKNIGPAEQQMTDSICACMTKTDMTVIQTKQQATDAFMSCFMKQASLLVSVTGERKVDFADKAAMREIGTDIGKNLLNQGCDAFMKLSLVMAKDKIEQEIDGESGTTTGKLIRIDVKEFNHLILLDDKGKEKTFIWLRQFDGADKFAANPSSYIGKKLSINWTEIEAYVPAAKAYFPVREILKLSLE